MKQVLVRTGRRQRGALTLVVVLILLLVLLLGGLAFGRVTESGTLVAGNVSLQERSVQASEIGVNTAFAQLKALTTEDTDTGGWYFATPRTPDADGLPGGVSWNNAPLVDAAPFQVRYLVERICTTTPVSDVARECLVKQERVMQSRKAGSEAFDPPMGREYRITVRVTTMRASEPKDSQSFESQSFVQALVTKS